MNKLNAGKRSGQKDDRGGELSPTRSLASVKGIPKWKANSGDASTSCHAASEGLGGELSLTVSGRRQTEGGEQEYVSQVDDVLGRAMDELDFIAASAAQHLTSKPSSVPKHSVTFADQIGTAGSGLFPAPVPTLRAWVMGDYFTEMLNALCALGFAVKNVRCWRNVRDPHGPRLDQLEVEKPDLVLVNALRSMHGGAFSKKVCRKVSDLLLSQVRSKRHFAFYGNPTWSNWDRATAPVEWRTVLEEPGLHVTELRW